MIGGAESVRPRRAERHDDGPAIPVAERRRDEFADAAVLQQMACRPAENWRFQGPRNELSLRDRRPIKRTFGKARGNGRGMVPFIDLHRLIRAPCQNPCENFRMQGADMKSQPIEPKTCLVQTASERGHQARIVEAARFVAAQPAGDAPGGYRHVFRMILMRSDDKVVLSGHGPAPSGSAILKIEDVATSPRARGEVAERAHSRSTPRRPRP